MKRFIFLAVLILSAGVLMGMGTEGYPATGVTNWWLFPIGLACFIGAFVLILVFTFTEKEQL